MKYLWEKKNWFDFKYDEAALLKPLGELRVLQGKLLGRVASLDLKLETEAQGAVLVEEAVRTAEIEGEKINRDAVRSSVAVRLGLPKGIGRQEKHIDGLVDVLLDAVRFHNRSLTLERLNGWQAALFPTGYSGLRKIKVGRLRGNEPMQVVSGPIGREKVHFEALPKERLAEEMRLFLKDLESLNMPGRYRRTLRYVLDTITRHEITPTDKEKVHMRELDATLRRFGDGISFQDYEMLMQSLAAADSRSPVSVLTNDIKLVRSFGRMARFLDSRGYMQANTVGIYTKFNGYRFKKGGEYPLSKI